MCPPEGVYFGKASRPKRVGCLLDGLGWTVLGAPLVHVLCVWLGQCVAYETCMCVFVCAT